MSATRIIAMRPLSGAVRSPRPLSRSQLQLVLTRTAQPTQLYGGSSVVAFQQRRHQSSEEGRKKFEPQPKITGKVLLHALRQSLSFRPLFSQFRGQNLRALYRQSPEELVIAIGLLAALSAIVVYVVYAYFTYFQSEQFTKFPPEIAKSLRRALYYSDHSLDPKLALKYYKLALEQCEQHGLDYFSDEVLGIKIRMAAWFEKIGGYKNAIEVLEAVLRDCRRWLDKMEQSVRDGLVDEKGRLAGDVAPNVTQENGEVPPCENLWHKRTRLLGKSVGISVKLGELHADEHVLQGEQSGPRLIWAVETVLKELQRRQIDGAKEGEGEWMSPEEIGGALEALAHHYESKSQHYLAAPLFLQAISLSPPKSCHTAVLMNNIAISLAQQPVGSSAASLPSADGQGQERPTRSKLLASAQHWAQQAFMTGSKVENEERTPECDEACAVALCNLGDIAAMSGDMREAKKKFKESLALCKRIKFEPGIIQAQAGLDASSLTPVTK